MVKLNDIITAAEAREIHVSDERQEELAEKANAVLACIETRIKEAAVKGYTGVVITSHEVNMGSGDGLVENMVEDKLNSHNYVVSCGESEYDLFVVNW